MLENSSEWLNLAKIFATLVLSISASFLFFYLALGARKLFQIISDFSGIFHKIDEVLELLKEKLDNTSSYLWIISESVKKLVDFFKEKDGSDKIEKKEEQ